MPTILGVKFGREFSGGGGAESLDKQAQKLSQKKSLERFSEQLPCRSVEVKFFSVFLCQKCREIWREFLVKFFALRFPGLGCAAENFTKISR